MTQAPEDCLLRALTNRTRVSSRMPSSSKTYAPLVLRQRWIGIQKGPVWALV